MAVTQSIHFDIQRKIVSNMTSESWETIPHSSFIYDADVTDFMKELKALNAERAKEDRFHRQHRHTQGHCGGLKGGADAEFHH